LRACSPCRMAGGQDGRVNACAMVARGCCSHAARSLRSESAASGAILAGGSLWWKTGHHFPFDFSRTTTDPGWDAACRVTPAGFVRSVSRATGFLWALRGGALAAECLIPFFRGEISLRGSHGTITRTLIKADWHRLFRNSSRLRRLLKVCRVPHCAGRLWASWRGVPRGHAVTS